MLDCAQIAGVARARGQGDVDIALVASADFGPAGIQRVVVFLVNGDGQSGRVVQKNGFCAIAMMYVPIQHCNFQIRLNGACRLHCHRDIGQQAKSVWKIR